MTSTDTNPPRLFGPRLLIQLAIASLVSLGIVTAAVWPRRTMLLPYLHPVRLHAPELWRIAAAPPAIQIHLAGVTVALAIGVILLAGVKGNRLHRTLGWAWVVAMMAAAVSSLFIRIINHGAFSFIHLLSGWTIIGLPMAVAAARRHKVQVHARFMTGLFTGGLILAGLLAFMPGRLMWQMVFD